MNNIPDMFYDAAVLGGSKMIESCERLRAGFVGDRPTSQVPSQALKEEIRTYLKNIDQAFNLFVEIHSHVIDACVQASRASTLDEARKALEPLQAEPLRADFKAKDWCKKIESFGRPLEFLIEEESHRRRWHELVTNREMEVLTCYDHSFSNLRYSIGHNSSFEEIQRETKKVLTALVEQKIEFNRIVTTAQQMLNQLL